MIIRIHSPPTFLLHFHLGILIILSLALLLCHCYPDIQFHHHEYHSQFHFVLIPQLHFYFISFDCLVFIFDVSLFPLSCNASSSLVSICSIFFRFFWKVFSFRVNFLSLGSRVVIIFSLLKFSLKVNRTLKTKKEFWYYLTTAYL